MSYKDHIDVESMEINSTAVAEQKRKALAHVLEAFDHAVDEGIAPEITAYAALFTALSSMVTIYGEQTVVEIANLLPQQVEEGKYSLSRQLQ